LRDDLFSIEELMPHVFVVVERHFHWASPHNLQLRLLLDLNEPAEPQEQVRYFS
jgi:hypothetical protein